MSNRVETVVSTLSAHVNVPTGMPVPLAAGLHYVVTDPFAVRLTLGAPLSTPIDWVFARDLLAAGLWQPTGTGDVLVRADDLSHTVRITLRNREGVAVIEASLSEVADFLDRTFALVPWGTESLYINVDRAIAEFTEQIG